MTKRTFKSRQKRNGFVAIDAICAASLLIVLLAIVAASAVRVAAGRRASLQQTVAEQVVMNAAERMVAAGSKEDQQPPSDEVPDWAANLLPSAKMVFTPIETEVATDFGQPVDLDGVRIQLSWDDRPGLPQRQFQTVVWR